MEVWSWLDSYSGFIGFSIFIFLALWMYLGRRKKGGGSGTSSPGSGGSFPTGSLSWMYIDDVETEANGPQDLFFALCLSKVYGPPILIGETFGKKAPGLGYVHKMIDNSGTRIPGPFRGASRLGMNQGGSQLSQEIVKWAHQSGDLRLCVGGKWTDVALAVKQDASIAKKIKVYGIGSSNALKDMASFNYLKSMGVWMTGPDVANPNGSDYLVWIRQASDGDGWMNRVMKPLVLGRLAMYPNGDGNNGGWLGEARRGVIMWGSRELIRLYGSQMLGGLWRCLRGKLKRMIFLMCVLWWSVGRRC